MKQLLLPILLVCAFCFGSKAQPLEKLAEMPEDKLAEQMSFDKTHWYSMAYNDYQPARKGVKSLKNLPSDCSIVVVGGLWCADTRTLLPELYKSTDRAGISRDKIKLHLVEPGIEDAELKNDYHVERIPTFIVMKDNKEIGRIDESFEGTIEEKLASILPE